MQIKNLGNTPFQEIVNCFFTAFEHYYVTFPKDEQLFRRRWEMAGINYGLSYGMFDDNTLVGFILHALDTRDNELAAFNIATGVIPEYRGKKIIKKLYDVAVPELQLHGVKVCILEVIKENTIAVKAYKSIGFNIIRDFKCFSGAIQIDEAGSHQLKEIQIQDVNKDLLADQKIYSWENRIETIKTGNFKYYLVLSDNMAVAYFIIDPSNGYVAQLEVLSPTQTAWNRLFEAIHSISKHIKINNIDTKRSIKVRQMRSFGLTNTIDQFEMLMFLK